MTAVGPPPWATRILPDDINWDLPYTLMVAFCLRLNIRWMGKASLFRGPLGPLMRWLGGIAVNRRKEQQPGGGVRPRPSQQSTGPVQLVVPPEGTRGRTRHWKTGFYFIALQAQVPIVLAYMDYQRNVSGLGPVFTPTGDVDKRHGRDQAVLRRHQRQARRSV
jgi:1-acyl-sn-glycerol-3-phosphate acyltransferase